MTNLAVISLGLFFFLGFARSAKNVSLGQGAVLLVGSLLYIFEVSPIDFLYLFGLTQISFVFFTAVSARPRRANGGAVWLAAIGFLVTQLGWYKWMGSRGAHVPVGLAYLTLQLLGVFIWSHFQKGSARIGWLKFNFSALFFPTVVAGPILRTQKIASQLDKLPAPTRDQLESAFLLICLGLFKKAVADQLFLYTSESHPGPHLTGWKAALLTLAFYSRCYADFSGYTDIARGLARAYGLEIPANFNVPFYAANISEHWRRWHMSLYEWFRDFVFTWLLASHFSSVKRRVPFLSSNVYLGLSVLLTCLLIGAWHGIGERYFLWGFLNGVLIVLHQGLFTRIPFSGPGFRAVSILFTFLLTAVLNLMFLDVPLREVGQIASAMLAIESYAVSSGESVLAAYSVFMVLLSIIGVHELDRALIRSDYLPSRVKRLLLSVAALAYCFSSGAIRQAFLYSQY